MSKAEESLAEFRTVCRKVFGTPIARRKQARPLPRQRPVAISSISRKKSDRLRRQRIRQKLLEQQKVSRPRKTKESVKEPVKEPVKETTEDIDIELEKRLKALYEDVQVKTESDKKEWKHVISSSLNRLNQTEREVLEEEGITDVDCKKLLECLISDKCKLPPKSAGNVWACARPPPCEGKERQRTTRGRKWCSGRSQENVDAKLRQTISDINTRIEARLKLAIDSLPNLEKDLTNVSREAKKMPEYGSNWSNELKQQADAGLQAQTVLLQRVEEKGTTEEQLTKRMMALMDMKDRKEYDNYMFKFAVDATKSIHQVLQQDPQQRNEVKGEQKGISRTDDKMAEAMRSMEQGIAQLLAESKRNRADIEEIKSQMNTVERAARRTLGEERWADTLASIRRAGFRGALKSLLKAPFKMLNILFLAPARNGFNIIFGSFGYKIWSIICFIILLLIIASSAIILKQNVPGVYTYIVKTGTYILETIMRMGSAVSLQLKTLFGEAAQIAMENAWETVSSYWNQLWEKAWEYLDIRGWIVSIIRESMPKMPNPSSILESMPSMPSLNPATWTSWFGFEKELEMERKMKKKKKLKKKKRKKKKKKNVSHR